ncbi:MAG: hypothetical protein OEY64_09970 [Nitrospinota bacterium]|nr:hypothetical protein [Nitrospinota bacterium]
MKGWMAVLKNEKGVALAFALLITMVLAIFSLVAVNSTGFSLRFSGEYRNKTKLMYLADGGADYGGGLVMRAVGNGLKVAAIDTGSAKITINNTDTNSDGVTDLEDELKGDSVNDPDSYNDAIPDAQVDLAGEKVNVDIDYVTSRKLAGTSSEFGSRYEGIGSGSAGSVALYYRIDSNNTSNAGKSATVRAKFKCVEGGARCL